MRKVGYEIKVPLSEEQAKQLKNRLKLAVVLALPPQIKRDRIIVYPKVKPG